MPAYLSRLLCTRKNNSSYSLTPLFCFHSQLSTSRRRSERLRTLPVTFRSHSVDVSHELGLSCGYDMISSGLFYLLPYDKS
jgi:hypothetical protein